MSEDRRGIYKGTEYLGPNRAQITYELPLAEVIYDMHDRLKSATQGYGTMDYEIIGYRDADLVKMDILVKGVRVDALSTISHRSNSEKRGRALVKRLLGAPGESGLLLRGDAREVEELRGLERNAVRDHLAHLVAVAF